MVPVYQSVVPRLMPQKTCIRRLAANLLSGFALYAFTMPTMMGMNMATRTVPEGVSKPSMICVIQRYIRILL